MDKLQTIERLVREQYEARHPDRNRSADWIHDNHVLPVAQFAEELAPRFGANAEIVRVAALLHDIADTVMSRFGSPEAHELKSLDMARQFSYQAGYNDEEVRLIVDDAIRFHSCHDKERPMTAEGKVLATADSLAHFKTDFYVYMTWRYGSEEKSLIDCKQWALKKLERDFWNKIQFDEVREECRADYEMLKDIFAR